MPEWSVLGKLRFDLGIEDLRIKVVLRDFETQTKGNKIAVRDKRGGGEDYYRIRSYFFINKLAKLVKNWGDWSSHKRTVRCKNSPPGPTTVEHIA